MIIYFQDKNEVLLRHMKKGYEFGQQMKDYFSELGVIETEYSQKLKRLNDKFFPNKKSEDDDIR